ncbi:hypothetical protein EWM64_g2141 [Hericium alpestre]|uniref:Mediator of RNA polymerase II transcription subunit 17 n=1 Tax=Hericium alpestre TaxID=135208 RepID=A0A4Z0A693_9AGAM|nr:hypothetical protein EWM64_g2141 [Hericium alpestre]
MTSDESDWKQLKLSLERPYKDDHGAAIHNVLDILPDGEYIYEPQEGPGAKLGDHLRRLFQERGLDFFEQDAEQRRTSKALQDVREEVQDTEVDEALESHENMTPEELLRMRMEILPQLHIALGEMSLARDVLAMFLSYSAPAAPNETAPSTPLPTGLTSSLVSRPPAIPSVQAFNAQLAVGGKDEALRKAANLFKSAAESVDRGCELSDRYWMDALRIRRRNWGLVPAPLPYGAPTGRGADKTTKDFLISYGLEESPPVFRRRALGHLASQDLSSDSIVFPNKQKTALRISLKTIDSEGKEHVSYNQLSKEDADSLDGMLRHAQREIVEQEVFSALIRDAGNLPTTSARVAERLIVIEAAQDTELRLELVDETTVDQSAYEATEDAVGQATCNLIYSLLHILLLRSHSYAKMQRLAGAGIRKADGLPNRAPLILQTVIDLLQYHMFCKRIKREMQKIVTGLRTAGVPTKFRFNAVGETGEELVRLLGEGGEGRVGGEAIIRVDNRYVMFRRILLYYLILNGRYPAAAPCVLHFIHHRL